MYIYAFNVMYIVCVSIEKMQTLLFIIIESYTQSYTSHSVLLQWLLSVAMEISCTVWNNAAEVQVQLDFSVYFICVYDCM